MAQSERRQGMDEVAVAIGGLSATVEAMSRRLDSMHQENGARQSEMQTTLVARIVDVQAQIHEVKHAQNNDAVKFARIEQQLVAHQEAHGRLVSTLEAERGFAEAGLARLEQEILTNRDAAAAREATIQTRLDDLFAWRRAVYAVGTVFVLALTAFGHEIWETVKHIGHWISK